MLRSSNAARLDPAFTEADWTAAGIPKVSIPSCPGLDPPFNWAEYLDEDGEVLKPADFQLLNKWLGGEVYTGGTYVGLNALRCYRYEATVAGTARSPSRKFGTLDAIVEDTLDIGAQFLRQTDIADLTWPEGGDFVPFDEADIVSVFSSAVTPIEALLTRLSVQDRKVVFTFLMAGTGSYVSGFMGKDHAPTDPKATITAPVWLTFDDRVHDDESPDPINGAQLFDLSFGGDTDTFLPHTTAVDAWVYATLDPRSPYKLGFVQLIAEQLATLLRDLFVKSPDLVRAILAIELFNEVDRKTRFDGTTLTSDNALGWAMMTVAALKGFTHVLGATADVCPLRFWLPSFASHSPPFYFDLSGSKISTMEFHRRFLQELETLLLEARIDPALIVNQDYHFYHFKDAQVADAIPISRIRDEIEALTGNVQATTHLSHVSISVCETGSALGKQWLHWSRPSRVASGYRYVAEAAEATSYPPGTLAPLAQVIWDRNVDTVERFQAREVWRRLAGGIAAGAAYVGWNTLMATNGGEFDRCGLREDSGEDSTQQSYHARKRYSWWAYQQLRLLLFPINARFGIHGGALGEFLLPLTTPGDIYETSTETVPAESDEAAEMYLVILHFVSGSKGAHTYVVFLDPTAREDATVFVDVSTVGPSPRYSPIVWVYPSIPETIFGGVTGVTSSNASGGLPVGIVSPGDLPRDGCTWADPWFFDATGHSLKVDVNQDPYVLVSDLELSFAIGGHPIPKAPPAARLRRLRRLQKLGGG